MTDTPAKIPLRIDEEVYALPILYPDPKINGVVAFGGEDGPAGGLCFGQFQEPVAGCRNLRRFSSVPGQNPPITVPPLMGYPIQHETRVDSSNHPAKNLPHPGAQGDARP